MTVEKLKAIATDQNNGGIQGIPLGVGVVLAPVQIADGAHLDWDVTEDAVIQFDSSEELRYGVNEEMSTAGVGNYLSSYAERYPLTEGVTNIRFYNDSGTVATLYRLSRPAK